MPQDEMHAVLEHIERHPKADIDDYVQSRTFSSAERHKVPIVGHRRQIASMASWNIPRRPADMTTRNERARPFFKNLGSDTARANIGLRGFSMFVLDSIPLRS